MCVVFSVTGSASYTYYTMMLYTHISEFPLFIRLKSVGICSDHTPLYGASMFELGTVCKGRMATMQPFRVTSVLR
ncbi:hypothetical protein SCP_0505940 [Sparassis crispa]|uniref:Uncharacterized protein n=1 Tax=Sparassis crispa TaxID=139825 RepID=A0A401GMY2_9APHY|nr:hypothetical protein SCP_0505940 [Sparassis crispa]GBE83540.1 hypothetical protein SCP_0505940 [Sparassis crispa]